MFSSKDIFLGRGAGATGYQISRSVRLRAAASAYFSRTFGSGGSQTTWTFSFWYKRGLLSQSSYPDILSTNSGSPNQNNFRWQADDTLLFYVQSSGSTIAYLQTTQVFRDPSSWYHIVLTIDTTNATSTDRLRLYVNGQRVTSFSSPTYPSQNQTLPSFNGAVTHYLGASNTGAGFNDCYMTEVNFVNGQALTPSSFGATSTTTGVWGPAKYTGTYGTNGFYLPFSLNNTSSYGASFSGSGQYLTLASNTAFNIFNGDMTVECWFYANSFTNSPHIFAFVQDSSNRESLYFNSSALTFYTSSSAGSGNRIATGTLTTGVWYHCAVVKSGSTFTLYLNGIAIGTSTTAQYSTANQSLQIGTYNSGGFSGDNFNGYISNVRVVKGTAVYTANFIPPTSALTAITNTQLLTLQNATIVDNSTNAFSITNTGSVATSTQYPFANPTIGADASGNANEWLPNNINVTTTGATYDSMVDTPTPYGSGNAGGDVRGNYCVLNPLANPNVTIVTYSNGNLNFSHSASSGNAPKMTVQSTFAIPSGKWYWEYIVGATVNDQVGIGTMLVSGGAAQGAFYAAYIDSGTFVGSYTNPASGASYTTNDVIGVAYDQPNGTLAFYKQTGGTGSFTLQGTITGISTAQTFYASRFASSSSTGGAGAFNFGQRVFNNSSPPAGYNALCTQNLSTPTIVNGASYMAASLYTGNGTSQSITNTVGTASFKPDLVWTKGRSGASNHSLVDSVRGITLQLSSNLTASEVTDATEITALNSNGFSVGNSSGSGYSTNANGTTYVGWQWLAGAGSSSTNTNGSITSTVSVNQTAGFSIVTYTGTGTTGTVGHGLGVTPTFLFTKIRQTSAGESWTVYFAAVGNAYNAFLNSTAAAATAGGTWNSTSPTSTVFTVQGGAWANINGNTMVAYCFAPIAGYSAFGSYTGNGSADGPFVYLGFRPRWVMFKRSDSAEDWIVFDTSRNTYDVMNSTLFPNGNYSETTDSNRMIDALSNGFKIRSSPVYINASGGTYVYACFAENPFKYALAR